MKDPKRIKRVVLMSLVTGFIAFLVFGMAYNLLNTNIQKKRIRRNMQIVQGGEIVKIERLPKSYKSYSVRFVFNAQGKEYRGAIINAYLFNTKVPLRDKKFPVVYESNNTHNAFILIKPEDFEYFDIPFPDSLNWVEQALR
jgi:hypothetical protein